MQKKDRNSARTGASRGPYIFLITAIIILVAVLLYLIGILFFPAFAKFALRVPGLSGITNAMVGNLYEENGSLDKKDVAATTESAAVTTQETAQETEETLLEAGQKDTDYLNHCIFLGDSRTVAMVTYGYVPEDSTLAEVGLCHVDAESKTYTYASGLQYTFFSYLQTHATDVVYLSYGINGIGYTDDQVYQDSYEQLVDDVIQYAPDSAIVIQSIWPVREGYATTQKITNSKVEEYNEFLYQLAQEKGVYYLDSAAVLKDDFGAMRQEYNSGDGLHYNEAGYEAVMDYLLRHPVPNLS